MHTRVHIRNALQRNSQRAIRDTLGELMASTQSTTVQHVPRLERLQELRIRAALTQAELAERAGLSRTTIVRLEQGDPNVLPSTLRKLARALKVKPVELWEERA